MGRFLDRHADEVSRLTVAPQEQSRLKVPRCYLDEYITLLKKIIPIVLSELVFNFDETGPSDWEDRKIKPVLVSAAEEDSTLHYPVNRNIGHHTLMCCVNSAGDAYCPMLIAPNAEATQIFDTGPETTSILSSRFDDLLTLLGSALLATSKKSSSQLWTRIDNYLVVKITSAYSSATIVRSIASSQFSGGLLRKVSA
jgi:hypothetical protein